MKDLICPERAETRLILSILAPGLVWIGRSHSSWGLRNVASEKMVIDR